MKKQHVLALFLAVCFTAVSAITVYSVREDATPNTENVCADCDIDDNLSLTAEKFIGKCCKGKIKSEFPGELLKKTVGDIKKNKSKNSAYKTAWKLISRKEYRK